MTDLMTDMGGDPDANGVGDLEGVPGSASGDTPSDRRTCQEPGCTNLLPEGSHQARKYCDDHFRGRGGRDQRRREGQTGEKAPKLVVEVGGKRPTGGKGDQRARETAAGAKAFATVIATGFAMAGDNNCATAVKTQANEWGDAVGELSKYQPWLATFFAPVGEESQLGAWFAFFMTTAGIAVPILAHHELLPKSIAAKVGGVMVAASDVAPDERIPGAA